MNSKGSLKFGLFMILTVSQMALAQSDLSTSRLESDSPTLHLSDLPMRLNTQLGVSSFDYSNQGSAQPKLASGVTVEFGSGRYRAETGVLFIPRSSSAVFKGQSDASLIQSNALAIPILAKARVYYSPVQSWSLKFGAIQTYEVSSNRPSVTNKIDVMASLGVSGRLQFTRQADFLVDASYNRGFVPALRSNFESAYNEGFLFLAGLSFKL